MWSYATVWRRRFSFVFCSWIELNLYIVMGELVVEICLDRFNNIFKYWSSYTRSHSNKFKTLRLQICVE